MIYEHETSASTGVVYLSRRTLVRVDGVVATAGEHIRRRGICPATARQRWKDNWPAWECVSRKPMKLGQKRNDAAPTTKAPGPVVYSIVRDEVDRVRFFDVPDVTGPHLAAWNGETWDVVDLPDGDCGVHLGNGKHCIRCAESVLWARRLPDASVRHQVDSNQSHPWRRWAHVEERVESFRKTGTR